MDEQILKNRVQLVLNTFAELERAHKERDFKLLNYCADVLEGFDDSFIFECKKLINRGL